MPDAAKPVSKSQTTITELMIPSYANFGGKIHGGILLSLMDKVAYACSSKHAGTYCVTVSVDRVEFLKPVDVEKEIVVEAFETEQKGRNLFYTGEIHNESGQLLARGKGRFVIIAPRT